MPETSVSSLPPKTAEETGYTLRVPVYSSMTDERGRIKPEVVLKLIDVAGCVPVKRHLGPNLDPVTASIDRMDFWAPVYPWEILILDSRLTRVWSTSMESRVVVTAWSFRTGETRAIASAYMVTVAMQNHASIKALPEQIAPLKAITPEDKLLRHCSDVRKEYRAFERQRASYLPLVEGEDDFACLETPMTACDSNGLGENVFGGVILSQMYQAAHLAVAQHLQANQQEPSLCVCVRQDRMDFLQPALIGETLRSRAILTKTFASSLEVQVECDAIAPQTGEARRVATTYFVFVYLDEGAKPQPVPAWQPQSPIQQERAKTAQVRRRLREEEDTRFGNSV